MTNTAKYGILAVGAAGLGALAMFYSMERAPKGEHIDLGKYSAAIGAGAASGALVMHFSKA